MWPWSDVALMAEKLRLKAAGESHSRKARRNDAAKPGKLSKSAAARSMHLTPKQIENDTSMSTFIISSCLHEN